MTEHSSDTSISARDYFRVKIDETPNKATARSLSQAFTAFTAWYPAGSLGFTSFSEDNLRQWTAWLLSEGYTLKTAAYYLKNLSALYGRAVADGIAAPATAFADVRTRLKSLPEAMSAPPRRCRHVFSASDLCAPSHISCRTARPRHRHRALRHPCRRPRLRCHRRHTQGQLHRRQPRDARHRGPQLEAPQQIPLRPRAIRQHTAPAQGPRARPLQTGPLRPRPATHQPRRRHRPRAMVRRRYSLRHQPRRRDSLRRSPPPPQPRLCTYRPRHTNRRRGKQHPRHSSTGTYRQPATVARHAIPPPRNPRRHPQPPQRPPLRQPARRHILPL